MELLCNYFKGVYDTNCLNVVKVTSVLSGIRKGKWKEQINELRSCTDVVLKKKLKNLLPAVTFCGVFEDSREDKSLVHYNNLMIVDIDKISEKRLKSLKEELCLNNHVLAYFTSPSFGLKILMLIDSDSTKHNTDAFYCVEKMFKDMYGIEIDKSGKNVARLCFVSYDSDLFYNPKAIPLKIESNISIMEGFISISSSSDTFIPTTNASKILETCIKMVKKSKTGSYRKGNRNNYIFVLSCLMCEFGVNYKQSLHLVFERYSSLGFPEVRNTVASAFRKNKHNFATKSVNERISKNQVKFF
jgi:hypothetical protein